MSETEQDWARCPSKVYLYMTARRPIITPPVGENPIALGKYGFYYTPDNAKSAAKRMSEALDNGDTPVNYPIEEYSWQTRTQAFLTWLKENFPVLDC
jgi:glycosyltransferase involved in cell wall biosynthesis